MRFVRLLKSPGTKCTCIAAWTVALVTLVALPSELLAQTGRDAPVQRITRAGSDSASLDIARAAKREALERLVKDAAERNRMPRSLQAYQANVETEISLVVRRADGTEAVASVEQIASDLQWTRTGLYRQRIQGHRVQQLGASISMLSVFRVGWLNPTLYGNRLRARQQSDADSALFPDSMSLAAVGGTPRDEAGRTTPASAADSARNQTGGDRRTQRRNRSRTDSRDDPADTAAVVHPLADDRDAWYRYSGGDTLVTLRDGTRSIPIVRVLVEPRDNITTRGSLFRGEMHLDASRGTLVRLRGAFVQVGDWPRTGGPIARLTGSLVDGVAYIDYENAERNQAYWLPTSQRIELQVSAPVFGDARAVIRIVSRFANMQLNTIPIDTARIALFDSLQPRTRRRLSYAPDDSLGAFAAWRATIGGLSQGLHADDFDEFGPDRWRTTGAPRFDWGVPQAPDLLRYNRVEGLYTGFGGKLALRDLSPGTVLRATAGYAWSEQALRGRVELQRDRGPWRLMLRAGRTLDITNDFRNPLDSGSTLGALTGQDEYDYVDRTFAGVQLVRTVGAREWQWRAETGVARDNAVQAAVPSAPLGRQAFRLNRGVDEGTYWRSAFTLAWRPDGSAEFLRPGFSGRLYAEHGAGELDYTRLEARLTARKLWGPFIAIARGDVGTVLGESLPSQQLFELGRSQGLPGFDYKDFAGTEAGVARGLLLWTGPWLRQPIRLRDALVLPPIAPGLSIGVQSGFTRARSEAALASVLRLGATTDSLGVSLPVSRVSDGWRSSLSAGLRFFSGSLFVGGAQPLERDGRWRWLVVFGQQL